MRLRLSALLLLAALSASADEPAPLSVAIIGLVHDHANGIIPRFGGRKDVQLVGVVEPDKTLAEQYAARFHMPADMFYPSLDALLAHKKVQVAALFTSTADHRAYVEACAAKGIDVMMEKPLATSLADAQAMAEAARKGGIRLVVNYETMWYPSLWAAYHLVHDAKAIGEVRKIVMHFGHEGPKTIGCSPYFLDWLTDPVKNGGGVTMDFGCYGADIATWMLGQAPSSVVAVAQNFQPKNYPKVEDEATIVASYPSAQVIIQASWNWPYDRKDVEIYGTEGALRIPDRATVFLRKGRSAEVQASVPALPGTDADPLAHLAAVVRRQDTGSDPTTLDINLTAMALLDAAKQSERTGCAVPAAH